MTLQFRIIDTLTEANTRLSLDELLDVMRGVKSGSLAATLSALKYRRVVNCDADRKWGLVLAPKAVTRQVTSPTPKSDPQREEAIAMPKKEAPPEDMTLAAVSDLEEGDEDEPESQYYGTYRGCTILINGDSAGVLELVAAIAALGEKVVMPG